MLMMRRKKYAVVAAAAACMLAAAGGALWWGSLHRAAAPVRGIAMADSIVAIVGGSYITDAELRQAFETSYPGLRHGATDTERLSSVLAAMLAEKVLAEEARHLGYDASARIGRLQAEFGRSMLVEQVIAADVDAKITVTDEEAREETMRSLVSFKFRYWMEPTRERAERVKKMMAADGFENTVQLLARQNPELKDIAPLLESDYLQWNEIDPVFFGAIKDLPIGGISVPVEHDGAFYLLEMEDIRRRGMTTGAVEQSLPTSRKVVFARKRLAARREYVAAVMEPKQVRTKSEALRILVDAVKEWHGSDNLRALDFFTAAGEAGSDTPNLRRYAAERSRILATTVDTSFTIEGIARTLPLRKIMNEYADPFPACAAYTAASVRDEYLNRLGRERGGADAPASKDLLRVWNDKWLYEEYREEYRQRAALSRPDPAKGGGDASRRQMLFRREQAALVRAIDSLVRALPPTLNAALLDTMRAGDPGSSRGMFVSVVRGGSDLPAFPLAGNEWQRDIPALKKIMGLR